MPEKLTSTLTLNIKKFIYNIIPYIIVCKLYFIAILRHLQPLLIENYIHFVAIIADFKTVSFYSEIHFLYHHIIIKLSLLLIPFKGSYSNS
jgi:hypothetical protein